MQENTTETENRTVDQISPNLMFLGFPPIKNGMLLFASLRSKEFDRSATEEI